MTTRRRILVVSNPYLGHFLPLVPLAQQLQADEHEVVVATEPAFGPTVREHGLAHRGVGRDLTIDDVLEALPGVLDVAPEAQDDYARPRMFVGLRAANVVDDLVQVTREFEPELVVRESGEFASWAIAEGAGLRHVAVGLGFGESARDWDRIARPWFTELGARVGADDLDATSLYRCGLLSFAPAGYHDWAGTPTAYAFRPHAVASDGGHDALSASLDDRPLVYATMGTEFYRADVMREVIEAIRAVAGAALVTTGPRHDPAEIDPASPDVVVTRWIDQEVALRRASAVISHGGAGTVTGALVHGLPLVVLPQGADQFLHARRVVDLGAGIALPPAAQTAVAIAEALTRVLSEPSYRRAAQDIARATERLPGVEVAAHALELLVDGADTVPDAVRTLTVPRSR